MNKTIQYLLLAFVFLSLVGCPNSKLKKKRELQKNSSELNTKVSNTTGWNYNDKAYTNFQVHDGITNVTPPGMVPIQGGTFTIGEKNEYITTPHNNPQRKVTVNSFYMDKYEITNINWNEYLHWLETVFGTVAPELVERAQPDHTVWREDLAYNDPYEQHYFEHPAFSLYPVVGVTWEQAMQYCQWRTDRVNEMALINAGAIAKPDFALLQPTSDVTRKEELEIALGVTMDTAYVETSPEDPTQQVVYYKVPYKWVRETFVFNTTKYLKDPKYNPEFGKKPMEDAQGNPRKVTLNDGILVTGYRLPTEAEWEFAAYAPVAGEEGVPLEGKMYPWAEYNPRGYDAIAAGKMSANFVRGRGDMMGVSGNLNDAYVITAPVNAFLPNDFGLYNMAGNVNEWVLDVYRETSFQDVNEYNAFRGNVYTTLVKDQSGTFVIDSLGGIMVEYLTVDDRRNVKDGDEFSTIETDYPLDTLGVTTPYKIDPTDVLAPRISSKSRVYKGGSWNDRIYWLNPSARRYLDQDKCSNTIGFRCAMSTLGNQLETATDNSKKR